MRISFGTILTIVALSLACVKSQEDESTLAVPNQDELDKELWAHCSSKRGMDDVDGVKNALAKGANVNHQDAASGQTPLMGAVLRGKDRIVRHLLDIKADVTIGEKSGYTPAHGAAFQGRPQVMKMLIDHGIDVNVPHHGDGFNPLMRTCWGSAKGHFETFKILVHHGIDPLVPSGNDEPKTCEEMSNNEWITDFLSTWEKEL